MNILAREGRLLPEPGIFNDNIFQQKSANYTCLIYLSIFSSTVNLLGHKNPPKEYGYFHSL